MSLAPLTSNTNRAVDPAASDVKDVQQNVVPQELFAAKCTPQGFLVLPLVTRIVGLSSAWTRSGTWTDQAGNGFLEETSRKTSNITNDFVEITVRARCFRLVFRGITDAGIANITIDGSNPSTIGGVTMEDGSAAQNTVDLYRASDTARIFAGYKGLSNAAHTIRITVSGTKNAASSDFRIYVNGIEYVDTLANADDGVACNQVAVLPYGDRDDLVDPGDTAAITYVGSWSNVSSVDQLMGRRRESSTAADYFEIAFTGTGIVLLFFADGNRGFLDITLDAALVAKRWTAYFGTTTHFNYPFSILGLSAGAHTVRVTVNAANENGGNKIVSLAGFFVVKDAHTNGYGGVLVSAEKRWNKTGIDRVAMAAPDASNPRKDFLVVNKSGVFSMVQGTAAAAPGEPAEQTDDRVPLAVVTQERSGIVLQTLHVPNLSTEGENEDSTLRQVQDRRRGILNAAGELPLGLQVVGVTAGEVSPPFRLPAKAKRVRVRRVGASGRVAIREFGSSPERRREFDNRATTPLDGFMNVDGWGGRTVELLSVTGTPILYAISVM